jgi:hypothetical protein
MAKGKCGRRSVRPSATRPAAYAKALVGLSSAASQDPYGGKYTSKRRRVWKEETEGPAHLQSAEAPQHRRCIFTETQMPTTSSQTKCWDTCCEPPCGASSNQRRWLLLRHLQAKGSCGQRQRLARSHPPALNQAPQTRTPPTALRRRRGTRRRKAQRKATPSCCHSNFAHVTLHRRAWVGRGHRTKGRRRQATAVQAKLLPPGLHPGAAADKEPAEAEEPEPDWPKDEGEGD